MAALSQHLVKDLRLLWRVLCTDSASAAAASVPIAAQPPRQDDELLKAVFLRASETAAATLGDLCVEEASEASAGANGGATSSSTGSRAADVEAFASQVALPVETLGVRTMRAAAPGSLMCFYPGRIFPGSERNLPMSNMLFSNEYEGVSMDGAGWYPKSLQGEAVVANLPKTTLWHGNRLAVGNLCNHPPKGKFPNVVPMAFRWPTWQELGQDTPAHWARLVPHVVMRGGQLVRTASGERDVPNDLKEKVWFPPWPHMGMALISIRPVQPGEELFWNYRLHPRSDQAVAMRYPDWYTPVDDDELERAIAEHMAGR
mmetsp:Transcript_78128/g.223892  ORF Transcript_78128/g.223892 Transcript_78128/m.223892 type:complete len:316 (-) Transcript_78128:84-1031(-)